MILTDDDIRSLIHLPKMIESRSPAVGYREANGQRRCDLEMQAASNDGVSFSVFVRQNVDSLVKSHGRGYRKREIIGAGKVEERTLRSR